MHTIEIIELALAICGPPASVISFLWGLNENRNLRKSEAYNGHQDRYIALLQADIEKASLNEVNLSAQIREMEDNSPGAILKVFKSNDEPRSKVAKLNSWFGKDGKYIAELLFIRAKWLFAQGVGEKNRDAGLSAAFHYATGALIFDPSIFTEEKLKEIRTWIDYEQHNLLPLKLSLKILDSVEPGSQEFDWEEAASGYEQLDEAREAFHSGRYEAAEKLCERAAVTLAAHFGDSSLPTISARSLKAHAMGRSRNADAMSEVDTVLAKLNDKKISRDSDLWRSNILIKAETLQHAYQLEACELLLSELVNAAPLPTDQYDYVGAMARVGLSSRLALKGSIDDAIKYAKQADDYISSWDREDTLDGLSAKRELASALIKIGEYAEAKVVVKAALTSVDNSVEIGMTHPLVQGLHFSMLMITAGEGNTEKALIDAQQIFDEVSAEYGHDYSSKVQAVLYMTMTFCAAGKGAAALPILKQTLFDAKQRLPRKRCCQATWAQGKSSSIRLCGWPLTSRASTSAR